jgi:hypothetical protein
MAGDNLAEVDVGQIAIVIDNCVETVQGAEPADDLELLLVKRIADQIALNGERIFRETRGMEGADGFVVGDARRDNLAAAGPTGHEMRTRSAGRGDRTRPTAQGESRLAAANCGRGRVHRRELANPVDRCFFCKTNLYGCIEGHTGAQILSGANLNDLVEYRPGLEAAKRHSVRHPYLEASIDKKAVRSLARELGLGALSELPAAPCLSSRVETGIAIRPEVQKGIHAVERSIAKDFPAGVVRYRVRAKGIVIELDPETLAAIAGEREVEVRAQAERIFAGIAPRLDLSFEPYRNGSAFVHSRA